MPIEVKHSGSAAPYAVAAYGGGQAKRTVADAPGIIRIGENRKDRIAKANDRLAALRAGKEARDYSTQQKALDRQARVDASGNADYENVYTDQQRKDYNQISQSYADAEASGDYSPDELAELASKRDLAYDAVKPLRQLKKRMAWGPEQGEGMVWTDPETGNRMTRSKGEAKKIADGPRVAEQKKELEITKALIATHTTTDITTGKSSFDAEGFAKSLADVKKAMQAAQDPSGVDTAKPIVPAPGEAGLNDVYKYNADLTDEQRLAAGAEAKAQRLAGSKSPAVTAKDAKNNAGLKSMTSQLSGMEFDSVPDKELTDRVKAAAKRNKVSEDVIWNMILKERNSKK